MGKLRGISLAIADITIGGLHDYARGSARSFLRQKMRYYRPENSRTCFILGRIRKSSKNDSFNMIPMNNNPRTGKIYIQRHASSHLHHDISIVDKNGKELFRGAVTKKNIEDLFPKSKKPTAFERQPQHKSGKYGYNFTGEIKDGYGEGFQEVVFNEKVEILRTNSDKITLNIYPSETNKSITGRFSFIKTDKSWLCIKSKPDLPDIKGKNQFKLITNNNESSDLPENAKKLEEKLNKPYTVEAKFDGSANLMKLGEKENTIWSWREGKKDQHIFLHDKFPNLRDDIHPKYNNTIIRGELISYHGKTSSGIHFNLFGTESPVLTVRFSLLSDPFRSRIEQLRSGYKTAIISYDLPQWKGRSTKNLTYREKIQLMDQISKDYKFIYTSKRWNNIENAWNEVVKNNGGEGIIIKMLDDRSPDPNIKSNGSPWFKVKSIDFYDLKINGFTNLIHKDGSLDSSKIGTLKCKSQGINTKVGTGFSDFEREWFKKNMSEVLKSDSFIKVKAHYKTKNGSLHSPVYKGVAYSKSAGPILELGLENTSDALNVNKYALKSTSK